MKRRGEISVDDALDHTGLARTTLREHLNILERDGWVEHRRIREGRGRPRLLYRLSESGQRLYPARDGHLLREFIAFLRLQDREALVEEFFRHYWQVRYQKAKTRLARLRSDRIVDRLREVEAILQEDGFMPDIEHDDGVILIRECNCPFPEVVKETRLPCRLEAEFFQKLLGRAPKRTSYIAEGDASCTYEL